LFGSVRQIKLAIRELLGARKYSASYRIVSYRIVTVYFPLLLWLCREAPIDVYDKYGFSPLMQAAQKGYIKYVYGIYLCRLRLSYNLSQFDWFSVIQPINNHNNSC